MAQKGVIDPNLEQTLNHFAELKNSTFLARRKNDVVSYLRPILGKLTAVNLPKNTAGRAPPNTTFDVWLINPKTNEKARATITTDSDGAVTNMTVNPNSQGAGWVTGDSTTIEPVDEQLGNEFPSIKDITSSASEVSWEGVLQKEEDLIKIHSAFETNTAEQKLIEAFNPSDFGNSSDGIVLPLQIDYFAQAERAYRARATHTFPRTLAHLSTREKGHGQPTGVFLGQALNYFILLLKQGASSKGGSV